MWNQPRGNDAPQSNFEGNRLSILKEIGYYDLCVLTGDYRGPGVGLYEATVVGMSEICAQLRKPAYGVLGKHDTICMLAGPEDMGVGMLL
jgi:hypothetical protein